MSKGTKKFIVVYALYLGWILSFLYRGALFDIIFSTEYFDMNALILATHTLPIIILFFVYRKRLIGVHRRKLLFVTIGISILASFIFLAFGRHIHTSFLYSIMIIIGVIAGISELLFIIVSTGWYIRHIKVEHMFIAMALITFLANCIVQLCNLFLYIGYNALAIAVSVLACVGALLIAVTIKEEDEYERTDYNLEMPKHTIPFMCAIFFLFSIGGGVVFEAVNPMMRQHFVSAEIIKILPYILGCLLVFVLLKSAMPRIDIFLIIATGLIIMGLMLFQLTDYKAVLFFSNFLIEAGYAVMDIFMWGLVALIAYVYNKPYKVVYYTMSFNVLGVICGAVISQLLAANIEMGGESAFLVSLICAVLGMLIIPIVYKETVADIEIGLNLLEKEKERIEQLAKVKQYDLLSNREKEVLALLIQNMTNKKVAQALYISENTLKKHAKSIYQKLEVNNKRELRALFENA